MADRQQIGRALTARAWAFVRDVSRLRSVPIRGAAAALVCAVVTIVAGANLNGEDQPAGWRIVAVAVVLLGAYVAALLVVYSNAVLLAAADRALRGDQPDLGGARATIRGRLGSIAGWTLVSAVATLGLGFVRLLGIAGMLTGRVWAAKWGLRSYLVAPVLVFEGAGALAALRRSDQLVEQRWGPNPIGNVAIGSDYAVTAGIGVFFSFLGMGLAGWDTPWVRLIGTVILIITISTTVRGAVICGATRAVFGAALYRYVAEQQVVGPFSAVELDSVAQHN